MKKFLKEVARQTVFVIIALAAFWTLFTLGHLAAYQEWPRWK